MDVGFVGLGEQGLPMAQMIQAGGFPLHVWARTSADLAPFTGTAATIEPDLAALARACDVIGVCVSADDDVREVVVGPNGLARGLRPGTVVAVHSTVAPDTVREVSAAVGRQGVGLVDAPVSGSAQAALDRTLVVMVGGAPEHCAVAWPVFETYGIPFLLGEVGLGQTMKLLNNTILATNLETLYSGLEAAEALGIPAERAVEVLTLSSGRSATVASYHRHARLEPPDRLRNFVKDTRNFLGLAAPVVDVTPFASHTERLLAPCSAGSHAPAEPVSAVAEPLT